MIDKLQKSSNSRHASLSSAPQRSSYEGATTHGEHRRLPKNEGEGGRGLGIGWPACFPSDTDPSNPEKRNEYISPLG